MLMNRLLLFLFLCVSALGANLGDIDGVTIETNGWLAKILIYTGGAASSTNGTFNLGLGANNSLTGNQKLTLSVTSQGFDDTGATNTFLRSVYGMFPVRWPYSSNSFPDTVIIGNDVQIKVALSEAIYASDAVTSCAFVTNLYKATGAATNSTATFSSVVNSSTLPYPPAIGAWQTADYLTVGSSVDVEVSAYHAFGSDRKSVQAIQVWVLDQHSASNGVIVTQPVWSKLANHVNGTEVYPASLSTASFTQGDILTVHFKVWPKLGDSTSVFDTSALSGSGAKRTFSQGSYLSDNVYCHPLSFKLDKTGSYGVTYARVDPVNGVDATGVASATLSSCVPFLTIQGAQSAICKTNKITLGRTNSSNCFIYLTNGTYTACGSTAVTHVGDQSWTTVTKEPSVARSDVLISWDTTSGNRALKSSFVKWSDVTITQQVDSAVFRGETSTDKIQISNCVVNYYISGSAAPFFQFQELYFLANTFNCQSNVGGIPGMLVRGNTFNDVNGYGFLYNSMCGNIIHPSVNQNSAMINESSSAAATADATIFANNWLSCKGLGLSFISGPKRVGTVFANNVFEKYGADAQPLFGLNSDGSVQSTTNVLAINNSFAGQRCNWAYNEAGSSPVYALNWHIYNNLFYYLAEKTDTFGTQNGARVGNWWYVFGVGCFGNLTRNNAFLQEFGGLQSSQSMASEGYVTDNSQTGTSTGNGNYRLTSLSTQQGWLNGVSPRTAFDYEGQYRGALDPPGAYASASPRKGAGFFAP